jgi:5-methylcytosine-specific restriction endonuclease McrA
MPHKDPGKAKAYFAARYEAKRAEISEQKKKRYTANPEPAKKRARFYRVSHWLERKEQEGRGKALALKLTDQIEKIDFRNILHAADGLCAICRKPFDLFGIEFDHIIPLARGGAHVTANIQATHTRCNRSKNVRMVG